MTRQPARWLLHSPIWRIVAHNLPAVHTGKALDKCPVTYCLYPYPTDHECRSHAANQHDAELDFGSFDSDGSQSGSCFSIEGSLA